MEKKPNLAAGAGGTEELKSPSISKNQIQVLNANKVRTKKPVCCHKISTEQRTATVHRCKEHALLRSVKSAGKSGTLRTTLWQHAL